MLLAGASNPEDGTWASASRFDGAFAFCAYEALVLRGLGGTPAFTQLLD